MSWLSLVLFVAATIVAVAESRAIAAEPVSLMMDSNGNPVLFLREKRAPVSPYPHRAMMFTGYYRPVRRANEGQATGVFAQGNAVSGGAYLGDSQPNYLQRGPEPTEEEADVSSAEAEAAPNPLEHHVDEEEQNNPGQEPQHDQEDSSQATQEEEQPSTYATEAPAAEEPVAQSRPSKKQGTKKNKKTPIRYEPEEDEDESEEEEDEDNDEPAMPFIPFKGNRRRQNVPNLNNFFPMVFSFPQGYARGGSPSSPGSPPGMITAIANSYSTSKGGVASSVATAYGGSSPPKKQRRSQPAQE